jgi:transcriptional regulator with XRE-family HTH domain
MVPMKIQRLVRATRRKAGMTQRQVASAAGVPQPTVARIESGAVSPRVDTLARLLAATGHELSYEPRLGEGIDRTAIRERLRMTPADRIRLAVNEARNMPDLRIRR